MKTRLFFLAFILTSTFAKANAVEDSLIANIGKKAKVIFYAENKADLNEIAKYDLNKLFAEVRKRSEKNFSNNEEVTLREADDLKNREVNTTVSTKKWLKNMNLNLFVGASPFSSFTNVVGPSVLSTNSIPQSIERGRFAVEGKTALMIGVGGFYDKSLLKKRSSELSIRYGGGFELINTKLSIEQNATISYLQNDGGGVDLPSFFTNEYKNTKVTSTNLYTSFIPTYNFFNSRRQKTFNIGLGAKFVVNFNNITFKENYHRGGSLYMKNSPYIFIQNPTFQTAFIATIGYKYLNAFIQVIPNHITIRSITSTYYNPLDDTIKQISKKTYIIGLRFGK